MSIPIPDKSDNQALSSYLSSTDPSKLAVALNILLKATCDHEDNYSLNFDGEKVINGLILAFERSVGWIDAHTDNDTKKPEDGSSASSPPSKRHKRKRGDTSKSDSTERPLTRAWTRETEIDDRFDKWISWSEFCGSKLSPPSPCTHPKSLLSDANLKIIECVIVIIRNLSFVSENLRFLGHSVGVLRMLSACFFCLPSRHFISSGDGDSGRAVWSGSRNACLYALHALINLAPFLDVTGRRLFADLMLLSQTDNKNIIPKIGYGQSMSLGLGGVLVAKRFDVREENLPRILNVSVQGLAQQHIKAILSLFPNLANVLECKTNRSIVVSALELIRELADNHDNHPVFLHVPDKLLTNLIHLLFLPRLGPDAIEYIDPIYNLVSRVSSLKLLQTYDATIDFEVRDRALEVLERLSNLSPDIKKRLGRLGTPRIYDYLIPIFITKVGRSDVAALVGRLLANMAVVAENQGGFKYVERKILNMAAEDPHVANVACNYLFLADVK